MEGLHAVGIDDNVGYLVLLFFGQGNFEQLLGGGFAQAVCHHEDENAHGNGCQRVQHSPLLAQEHRASNAKQRGNGREGIGTVVPGVGLECRAAGLAAHEPRVVVEPFLDRDGDKGNDEGDVVRAFQRCAVECCPHILHAVNHQPECDDDQDDADEERCQRLILAPAVAVPFVGTLAREAHHGKDERVGHRVADAVDAIGKDGTGTSGNAGNDFQCRQCDVARHAHQGAVFLLSIVVDMFSLMAHQFMSREECRKINHYGSQVHQK